MKKIFAAILIMVFFASPAFAGTWCNWDGSTGINSQSDSKGYILINGRKTSTPAIANAAGWYKVVVSQPTVLENQVKDSEVWAFVNNEISKTWTVRDMTTEELDQRTAAIMSIESYYIWAGLLASGLITIQQAVNFLPAEMVQAYQARKRLENP